MRRVAEIIYIVPEERAEFINGIVNPDMETQKVQWLCGVRNQQYYDLNGLLFMTFEYSGTDFNKDMEKMAAYLDSKGHLVKLRRKDVPVELRATTNWWAPVKKLGTLLERDPRKDEKEQLMQDVTDSYFDGLMISGGTKSDLSYNESDWVDAFSIV